MGCLGVHFAITPEQAKRFREAEGNDKRLEELPEETEERWDKEHLQETDKAWDAIHRCLTDDFTPGGRLDPESGLYPLNCCILGGEQLYGGESYHMVLVNAADVPAVAQALVPIGKAWVRKKFFALDPDLCLYPINEDEFEYTWYWFKKLRGLFAKAAAEGRAVLFTASL